MERHKKENEAEDKDFGTKAIAEPDYYGFIGLMKTKSIFRNETEWWRSCSLERYL